MGVVNGCGTSKKAWVLAAVVAGAGALASSRAFAADQQVDFTSQIQPIFKDSCIKCHSLNNPRKTAAGGLRLDDKESALKGGKLGGDIVPGDSTKSLMYKLLLGPTTVNGKHVDAMPKQKRGEEYKPLDKEKIELLKSWIDQGAKWSS